jgi:transposase
MLYWVDFWYNKFSYSLINFLKGGARMRRANQKYGVHLDLETRTKLKSFVRKEKSAASKVRHARILLLADEDHPDGQRPDTYIAEAVDLSLRTVIRVRRNFVKDGLHCALNRKLRKTPPTPRKFDGEAEAKLVTLACSTPPKGHQRWTLRLLTTEVIRTKIVLSVCPETIRRTLKKTV